MKRLLFLLVVATSASASAGKHVETESLGTSPWADTEISTNIAFSIGDVRVSKLGFTLDFDATSSNNVQVAFGKDVDGDGSLAMEEQQMVVGWDCGRWLVCGEETFACDAATTNAHKVFAWTGTASVGRMRTLGISENDRALEFGLPVPYPDWTYDREWDLIRITVRGIDAARERFWVKTTKIGTQVIIR